MKLKDRIFEVANFLVKDSFEVKKTYSHKYYGEVVDYTIRFSIARKHNIRKCDVILRWLVMKYQKMVNEISKRHE